MRFLSSALALGLLLGAPVAAYAADNDHHPSHRQKVIHHQRQVIQHKNRVIRHERRIDRADWAKFRVNVRHAKRYHWNVYVRPAGWRVHHWKFHETLPRAYFANNYWINDYASFGLMGPPEGLVWVRVGDDALLIDRDSGDILRVEYDVFD